MLEQMRQKGASIFIYLIFGLLILIFVINFAPNAGQGGGGCSPGSNVIVDVDGARAGKQAFHVAYSNPLNQETQRRKVYFALDTLIRRELLASAAEERGIRTTREMVEEEIKRGNFFIGGQRVPLGSFIFDEIDDNGQKRQVWNLRKFKGWVQSLDVSQNAYIDEQKRGLQAALMAELLASSAQVSRDEALAEYLFENTTVAYDLVELSPAAYRAAMLLTDADVERFLASHEDQVKARHKEREREFLDRKPELRLRQIFIAAAPAAAPADAAKPDAKTEEKKPGAVPADVRTDAVPADAKTDAVPAAGAPAKPVLPTIAEAKARLEAAREQVAGGKAKFADLAKQLNTEPQLKANGGDVGWKTAESASLGEKVVSDAVKTLKPGEMTPVITTERGAYLVIAEDRREKNLTYDQVKHELAAELAREVWSKEAAKRAALAAFAAVRDGKKNLGDAYQRDAGRPPGPGLDLEQLLQDPSLDENIKRQLRQQLQGSGRQGAIEIESTDVPAAWKTADANGAGGSAGSGSAAAPAAGSAAAPAAGAPAPAPATAEAKPLAPSSDTLPAFTEVPAPKVKKEGPRPRAKSLPGLDADAVRAVFDELAQGQLVPRVIETDGGYSLVQVVEKNQAKIEEFEKEADRRIANLREERGRALVEDWLRSRCETLREAGKIRPSADYTAEVDEKGNPAPVVYRACWTLR